MEITADVVAVPTPAEMCRVRKALANMTLDTLSALVVSSLKSRSAASADRLQKSVLHDRNGRARQVL
jgi:hypothetical protein